MFKEGLLVKEIIDIVPRARRSSLYRIRAN